jgi:putative membrane protein
VTAAVATGRQRLHPATPLLKAAKLLAAAVAAISWQGYAQLGFYGWLATVAMLLVGTVVVSAISWWVTGYELVGRELRIHEGLLWRRTRAIPLERLQAVDVFRPLLARLTGVAELRLEVVGGGRPEAPLAFLAMSDALRLRAHLLETAGAATPTTADATAPGVPPAEEPERVIHAVDNRDVLLSQLLTPPVWFVPFGIVATLLAAAQSPVTTFIGVASTLTALVGVVQVPVRRVLAHWTFRVSAVGAGLRLRHGALDTRSQTIPPRRVQAVGLVRPLLWRPLGWLHARVDVAGYGRAGGEEAGMRGGVLLPVGDAATAHRVAAEVLQGIDVTAVPLAIAPRRARWLAPLRQPRLGFGLTATAVAAHDGWLRRTLLVAPLSRVQSVRVVQGPLQRRLRIANVHVDTAGSLHLVGQHRDAAEAYRLAEALTVASRAARLRERATHPRSASPTAANIAPTYAQPTSTSTT